MTRPLLLGHRGARAVESIPENTIASFDRCLADGCDGFEFDVRLTADGEAIVCHDSRWRRIELARATARQLPALPTLAHVLERYRASFLDIELKVAGLENITIELLRSHRPTRGLLVSSFLPEILKTIHDRDSTIPLGLICETKSQLRLWPELPVDYVLPRHNLAKPEIITELHRNGKKVIVWTVNTIRQMHRFAELGVDGIISDNPSLLSRTLGNSSQDTKTSLV